MIAQIITLGGALYFIAFINNKLFPSKTKKSKEKEMEIKIKEEFNKYNKEK